MNNRSTLKKTTMKNFFSLLPCWSLLTCMTSYCIWYKSSAAIFIGSNPDFFSLQFSQKTGLSTSKGSWCISNELMSLSHYYFYWSSSLIRRHRNNWTKRKMFFFSFSSSYSFSRLQCVIEWICPTLRLVINLND